MAIAQTAPLVGGNKIARNTVGVFIRIAKLELPPGVALFGGPLEPLYGFGSVTGNAISSVAVHDATVKLRVRITLLGGAREFLHRPVFRPAVPIGCMGNRIVATGLIHPGKWPLTSSSSSQHPGCKYQIHDCTNANSNPLSEEVDAGKQCDGQENTENHRSISG